MDMSTHPTSFGESRFVFDQTTDYSFELANTPSQTSKQDFINLSPFRQDAAVSVSGHLSLNQLKSLHESPEQNSYLSCSNSPSSSPANPAGIEEFSSEGHGHTNGANFYNSNNSLGLMGSLDPSSPSPLPFTTSHDAMMRPSMLQRQTSMSNLSDTSGSSYYNDGNSTRSQSLVDPTSPIRSSFTPAQSPLGFSHSLSSISGLAIGTPQHTGFDLSGEHDHNHSPFQGRNHDQLLSLSGSVHMMPPPVDRRRTSVTAHTLYTNAMHQSRDENDDSTPMPPSMQTFDGQQSHDVSNMTQQHHHHQQQQQQQQQFQHQPMMPMTPGRNTISGMVSYATPHSTQGTPDDSIHSSISSNFSNSRLRRMDSYDSTYGSAISSPISEFTSHGSYPFPNRSLEQAITEQEAKYAHYASQGQQGVMNRHPNVNQISSSAMSRVSSAPAPSLTSSSDVSSQFSIPGTPNRTSSFLQQMQQSQQQHQHNNNNNHHRKPSLPLTPNNSHHNYDLSLSAPQMISSRSMSSMQSPMGVVSPMSLMDPGTPSSDIEEGELVRSPSSGASRTLTPRSRIRVNIPPPLIVSSADKLHVCFCGKRFKRLEHLKRHNRVHTQERPHACPAPGCNKWFGRTDNLTQHLKTHYRTVGRSSENLLNITNAKTSSMGQHSDARHDPHAAAAAAAAQAVSKTHMKVRRSTVSNDVLGGPISLNRPSTSPNMDDGLRQFTQSPL